MFFPWTMNFDPFFPWVFSSSVFISNVSQSASQMARLFTSQQLVRFNFPQPISNNISIPEACVLLFVSNFILVPKLNIKRPTLDYNKHFQLHFGVVGLDKQHFYVNLAAEFTWITGTQFPSLQNDRSSAKRHKNAESQQKRYPKLSILVFHFFSA